MDYILFVLFKIHLQLYLFMQLEVKYLSEERRTHPGAAGTSVLMCKFFCQHLTEIYHNVCVPPQY